MKHTHSVIVRVDDKEDLYVVECSGGTLCESTNENRAKISFVSVPSETKPSLLAKLRALRLL